MRRLPEMHNFLIDMVMGSLSMGVGRRVQLQGDQEGVGAGKAKGSVNCTCTVLLYPWAKAV